MAYISVPSIWRELPEKYRLAVFKCKSCGALNFPRRRICVGCRKPSEFEEQKASGRGKVYSYTVVAAGATASEHAEEGRVGGPFPVAIVELEEGIRVMGQVTDCDPSAVKIGMNVESVFRKIYEQDGIIRYGYKFRPVEMTSGRQ